MKAKRILSLAILVGIFFSGHSQLTGQQIHLSAPFTTANDSFSESFGTNFGFSFGAGGNGAGSRVVGLTPGGQLVPNVAFTQNNSVFPAFGGFLPGNGAQFGFGRRSPGGGGFSLGFNFAQGSSRSFSSVTPSLTIPNGGFGSFSSGQVRPFVTGVVPVVGTDNAVTRGIASGQLKPYDPNRTKERPTQDSSAYRPPKPPASSANYGDLSVAEIKAEKKRLRQIRIREFKQYVDAARVAEGKEDYSAARRNIRQARTLTDDPKQKYELRAWLKKLQDKR